jgi:DNA-directed RNA polymerase subunit RPC12/RpoP
VSHQTLKELLRSPFEYLNGHVRNTDNEVFCDVDDYEMGHEDVGNFIAAALNEKWERDFEEPMRWIEGFEDAWHHQKCPKCSGKFMFDDTDFDYCPHCGQRLLPPEEKEIK